MATARWAAKALEYPVDGLRLEGEAWPWTETVRPFALAILGVVLALVGFALVRRWRRPRPKPAAAESGHRGGMSR